MPFQEIEVKGKTMAQRKHGKGNQEMMQPEDAIAMLKADHQRVRDLFQAYEAATEPHAKRDIAEEAFVELETHAQLEEQIFYPAVNEETDEGPPLVHEALQEHQTVKHLIHALRAMRDFKEFDAAFHELVQNVEHHAEEEESEMFPLAEVELEDELDELKEEMQEMKAQLLS
jgi:hemerythrin-like domain-containing protein